MFSQKLKALRKEKGLTQEQLAALLGVERSSVGKYEGKSQIIPSDDIKLKIAEIFNVSVDYLLDRELSANATTSPDVSTTLTPVESELLAVYRSSNEAGREYLMNTARMVADNPAMQKEKGETASA